MSVATFVAGTAPGALPGLGHMVPLLRHPTEFLASLPEHGDLVEIRLGRTRAYVPCHPELLRQVLTDDRTFDKGGTYYDKARDMAGNGVATCPHQDHRRQRRLIQPAFHRTQLERYGLVMEAEVGVLTDSWGDEPVVDAYPELYSLAARIVTRTLFGTHVDEDVVAGIRRSFEAAFSGFFRQMFMPEALRRLPLPANLRHRRALRHLRGTVERIIAEYRRSGADRGDLLSVLLAARDEGDGAGMADGEIHDQVVTVLAAGTETVAATLTWACYLLSQNPAAQRELHEEVDTVLKGGPAGWGDIPQLPYTDHVINETIRLYPPGWLFTRVTATDVELAGRHLAQGTTVVISPAPVHRHSSVFERPLEFDPGRWAEDRAAALPRGAFVGFGAGPRKCIGDGFGAAECAMALATMVSGRSIRCEPGADVRPVPLAAFYRPRHLFLRLPRR
ncbi:cytochrome P450 [Streptomyces sp. ISL-98]|uniref:cytochrome P450 n=1 Tax=Streptomyces sp. ISL-98 TaxID=2819192 RepID=UPI001BEA0DC1|nr:cytochrome P450 [Streptomyces sp. ISL-98]MBT2506536.1 cytochrome P450 [Streptomyces sp. ISL-98]